MSIKTVATVAISVVLVVSSVIPADAGVLRGCRKTGDGSTICPGDLGVTQTTEGVLRGCRKTADGSTICPGDL